MLRALNHPHAAAAVSAVATADVATTGTGARLGELMRTMTEGRFRHLPVVVDPSHAGGRKDLVVPLSRASMAVGADGVIVDGRLNKIGRELRWDYDWAEPLAPWHVVDPDGQLDIFAV